MKNAGPAKVYQFMVTINGIRPLIWRRIQVGDKVTLPGLHHVLQKVLGWGDCHPHEFTIAGARYGDPAADKFGDFHLRDETEIPLHSLGLEEGSQFTYRYDFSNGWQHILVVEAIFPYKKDLLLPQCLDGQRACPPENVGGGRAYEDFLEAISDPQNDEHEPCLQWVGGKFNPEAFDLAAINLRLHPEPERGWPGGAQAEMGGKDHKAFRLFAEQLSVVLPPDCEQAAQLLAVRLDTLTFLHFLQKNKVTGAPSTGNIPRKTVAEIAGRFVNPPGLGRRFNGPVVRLQSEEEVWPVYFVHNLAQAAGLVTGGAGRRWQITPVGEDFISQPAAIQTGRLFAGWWYGVDWTKRNSSGIFDTGLPEDFGRNLAAQLLTLPVNELISLKSFTEQLLQCMGWMWLFTATDAARSAFHAAAETLIIEPLEQFGVCATQPMQEKDPQRDHLVSLTEFGAALLKAL